MGRLSSSSLNSLATPFFSCSVNQRRSGIYHSPNSSSVVCFFQISMNASLRFLAVSVLPDSNSQDFIVCSSLVHCLLHRGQCFTLATYICWAFTIAHCAAFIVFVRISPALESFGLLFRTICIYSDSVASLNIILSHYDSANGASNCLE